MLDSMLFSPEEKPRYGYNWAWGVFDQFTKKYARATDIFSEFSGLSKKQIVNLIIRGDSLWPCIRTAIKTIQKLDSRLIAPWDLALMEGWLLAHRSRFGVSLAEYLNGCLVEWKNSYPNRKFGPVEGLTGEKSDPILEEH